MYMGRKQPLGQAERKKEGERKKWCSIMTRWTPGARWDTPGFIGLGTLQGPHYAVCVHLSTTGCVNYTLTHTHLHFKEPYQAIDSYPVGSPPPTANDVAKATGKQTLVEDAMPTPCIKVKFAFLPFFSSLHLSFGRAESSRQLSFMTRGRHAWDMLMYEGKFAYSAEYWPLCHCEVCPCKDTMKRSRAFFFSPLSCWAAPPGYCRSGTFHRISPRQHVHCLAVNMPANSLHFFILFLFFLSIIFACLH